MKLPVRIPGAVVQLTEAEREELARRNAEQNKRSEDNARAKRG
ncbi:MULTISPECIES: hypothetical protein [Streptomyces]|uniref:Uncharacterized protein n=1 Tax=Streptomyces yatensis TaxID=155177 RepID=A0ABP4VGR2_9ACTN|nr:MULTISPECIES: hypothetical protein [Streptomyces]